MGAKEINRITTRNDQKDFIFKDTEKFELVSCPMGGFHCKDTVLADINRLYRQSDIFRIDREYEKSISLLKEAYQITQELQEKSCANCVSFFQNNIIESMKIIQKELDQMSKGIFSTRRYKSAYNKLGEILNYINLYRESGSYLFSSGNNRNSI